MDKAERERMVADAILMERAARALRRWRQGPAVNISKDVFEANIRAAGHLQWLAGELRDGAESNVRSG